MSMSLIKNNSDTNILVKTSCGKEVSKDKTRRINGKYYIKGETCFLLESATPGAAARWVRIDSPLIAYDVDKREYQRKKVLKDQDKIEGIYENNKTGYFINNPLKTVLIKDSEHDLGIYCYSKEIAIELGYVEDISTGIFYKKENQSDRFLNKIRKPSLAERRRLDYGANEANGTYSEILSDFNKFLSKNHITPQRNTLNFSNNFLRGLSFGIEFETSNGTIPKNITNALGLVPLRDGSIGGYEYTTVPLSGAVGLEVTKIACKELSERCCIDHRCSMHIHIGGIPKERKYALAFMKVAYLIQDEIMQLVQPYKASPAKYVPNWNNAKDNYCKLLPTFNFFANFNPTEIEVYSKFQALFRWVCGNNLTQEQGPYTFTSLRSPFNRKWEIESRYYWVNIFNYIFSNSKTVEFRLHTPTLNFTKTSNWMLICLSIVKFVEKYQDSILSDMTKLTLDDVLKAYVFQQQEKGETTEEENEYLKSVYEYISAYVDYKKDEHRSAINKGLYFNEKEFKDDPSFVFEYNGMKTLY